MNEYHVDIPSDDGPIPAFVALPATTPRNGLIVYMDVFGPRQELYDICRQFASHGFNAVLPNLFHRIGSPIFAPMNLPTDTADPGMAEANASTTMEMTLCDTQAIVQFGDEGGFDCKSMQWLVVGYCMGGRHALSAAASMPERIEKGASIHGGRLVTANSDSPHLLISQLTVPFYFAFATDDPTCPDDHQALIRSEARRSQVKVDCERLDACHGWTFQDRWSYDSSAANRVWETLLAK